MNEKMLWAMPQREEIMKRDRAELDRLHKEKCRELKQIRAKMAEDLGIDLKQRECTYEGYCSGTCPKCKSEELALNAAILKKQMEDANLKARVAAAGLTTVAAVCLSGCGGRELLFNDLEGATQPGPDEVIYDTGDWEGGEELAPDDIEDWEGGEDYLEGDVVLDTEYMDDGCVDTECIDTEIIDTESMSIEIME